MENMIRLGAALGIFFMMISWEALAPKRIQPINRPERWPVNLGLALLNMLLMRLTIGSLALLSAIYAAEKGVGLLNLWPIPKSLSILLTLLILDLAIYGQHILMHKCPLLWRLHQVHHADLECDATTAVRFHPLEIMLSMLYKGVCIILIGGQPEGIIAFEIILNGAATFNHSNVKIPDRIDTFLRWLIITPDMHRIHHSVVPDEMNSNYGFSISCWDRGFKTYTAKPQHDPTTMDIGLNRYRQQRELRFLPCLSLPFKS